MDIVAITSEMYPYSSFDEKAETTSEYTPKAGNIRM